jgi:hypothetical protein
MKIAYEYQTYKAEKKKEQKAEISNPFFSFWGVLIVVVVSCSFS